MAFLLVLALAATLGAAEPDCGCSMPFESNLAADPWIEPGDRRPLGAADVQLVDQDGIVRDLRSLAGTPLAITFVYTRCGNPNKCPRAARAMASLQAALPGAGLAEKLRLAIATYDPDYDTTPLLTAWCADHGLQLGARMLALRPDAQRRGELFVALGLSVNFADGTVNLHDIELLLLDRTSRIAKRYHSMVWSDPLVLADLSRLAAER
jgi:cytochrome oxidase Cu insertion factor (SCO1/SenC/PrrC family)